MLVKLMFLAMALFAPIPSFQNSFAQQNEWKIVFSSTGPGANQVVLRSPFHKSDTTDDYTQVNSKYNQPRSIGTNPHQGLDLFAPKPRLVYPPAKGKVVEVNGKNGVLIIQLDWNDDGE